MTLDEALALPGASLVADSVETDFEHGHKVLGRVVEGVFYGTPEAKAAHAAAAETALDDVIADAAAEPTLEGHADLLGD